MHNPDEVLLLVEIRVILCRLQAKHKSKLSLPPSYLIVKSLIDSVWNSGTSPADVYQCSNCVQNNQQ